MNQCSRGEFKYSYRAQTELSVVCKTKDMANKANKAVENGEIKFHPENWIKTYFN